MHSRLKLTGDGTNFGTELIDVETGADLFARYAIESARVETDSRCVAGPRVVLVLDPRYVEVSLSSIKEPFLDISNAGVGQGDRADRTSVGWIPALMDYDSDFGI